MFKRQTEGLGHLHVVRRAGRRQRRDLLQLRPPQPRAVGLCDRRCGGSARTWASCRSSIGGTITLYVISLLLSRRAHPGDAVAQHRGPVPARRQRRGAGVPVRPLVDGADGRLAARRRAAHPLQRDVDPPARAGRGRPVRRRADGDHLHRGRRRSGSPSARLPGSTSATCRSSAARRSRSAPRRRSSACSARWSTTAGAPAAATSVKPACSTRCSWVCSGSSFPASTTGPTPVASPAASWRRWCWTPASPSVSIIWPSPSAALG